MTRTPNYWNLAMKQRYPERLPESHLLESLWAMVLAFSSCSSPWSLSQRWKAQHFLSVLRLVSVASGGLCFLYRLWCGYQVGRDMDKVYRLKVMKMTSGWTLTRDRRYQLGSGVLGKRSPLLGRDLAECFVGARLKSCETRSSFSLLGSYFPMVSWHSFACLVRVYSRCHTHTLCATAFTTITSTAILFGKTSLNMKPSALILIGIIVPLSGILGSLFWPRLQRRYEWSNLRVLLILLVLASLIPAYGCLGFVGVFHRVGFGGLTTQGEMFGLAVFFGTSNLLVTSSMRYWPEHHIGFVLGAFNGYARAFYAELLPPGEEARWCVSISFARPKWIFSLIVCLFAR